MIFGMEYFRRVKSELLDRRQVYLTLGAVAVPLAVLPLVGTDLSAGQLAIHIPIATAGIHLVKGLAFAIRPRNTSIADGPKKWDR
jgi:hypothetical protein